ncbi:MAG: hypothetical protein JWP97_2735 [Labilithrix sp.]|nr:hypothetical protein [Labilithrix sp.]
MAHLNVRERRIEAKIAYVGAELAGNLDHLANVTRDARRGKVETLLGDAADRVSLAWSDAARFRDCSVMVDVVAQRGPVTEERFRDVMRGTDGVIVVVDSAPDANARNEATLSLVREILASEPAREVPVVLQVDESVVETFDMLLDQVFAALPARRDEEEGPATVQPKAWSDGGHPLLTALRGVLRDTVSEHMEQLETRMAARVDASFERVNGAVARIEARLDRMRDELKAETVRTVETRARAEREHLATATGSLRKSIEAVSADVKTGDARARVAEVAAALAALGPRLDQLETAVRQRGARTEETVVTLHGDTTQRLTGTDERVDAVSARVAEIVEELKKPKKSWFT